MTLATVTQRVFEADNKTVTDFANFIENIVINDLGFTLVDNNAGSVSLITTTFQSSRVYSFQYNNFDKGTVYWRICYLESPPFVKLGFILYTSWNSVTKIGASPSNITTNFLSPSSSDRINLTNDGVNLFNIYDHPEAKIISNSTLTFGIVKPLFKSPYWSENVALNAFGFYVPTNSVGIRLAPTVNAYFDGSVVLSLYPQNRINANNFLQRNPVTERYNLISGPHIIGGSGNDKKGIVGSFSSDIVIGPCPGLNSIVQITQQTTKYQFMNYNPNSPSLGVKIAD